MQEKKRKMLVFLLLAVMAMMAVPFGKAKAAGTALTIETIDYEKEELKVVSGSGDTYLYYSDAKKKNWECAGKFTDNKFVMDISWVSKTKDYVLVLKGDKSGEVSVTLPKQDKSFKATYNYKDETLTFQSLATGREVFWRKADSTKWKKLEITNGALDRMTLDYFRRLYARGATLYLRVGQVAGNGTSAGARPSKEVKLALTKQASAPNLSVKHPGTVTVNDKQEYQVAGASEWTAVTGKTLEIAKVATDAFGASAKETKIFIRVAATEKKLPSASATLTVLAQEAAPPTPVPLPTAAAGDGTSDAGAARDGTSGEGTAEETASYIKYDFVNVSTLEFSFEERKNADGNVTVAKPSSKNPYEYTIVEKDAELKDDATWTAITSEKFQVTAQKAPAGATVYIRKRGRLESTAVWRPESLACEFTVPAYPDGGTLAPSNGVNSDAVYMKDDTLYLVKEEGVEASGLSFDITLIDQFKDNDISGITCGGKKLEFTSSKTDLVIHVEITDTSAYEAAETTRDKEQDVKITMKNGEVIDKVKLMILHGASVEAEKTFSVTHGLEPDSASPYEFIVVPGLTLPKKGEEYGKTTVKKLTFMGADIDTGDYKTTRNGDSYTIEITAAAFNEFFLNSDVELDKAYPLIIEMSNGQKIEKGVDIKLYEELKAENALSFTKSVGKEQKEDIVLKLTATKTGVVNVTGATWNNHPIQMSATQDGTTITVTLGSESINELTLPVAGQSSTAPIVFTVEIAKKESQVSLVYWLTLTP